MVAGPTVPVVGADQAPGDGTPLVVLPADSGAGSGYGSDSNGSGTDGDGTSPLIDVTVPLVGTTITGGCR